MIIAYSDESMQKRIKNIQIPIVFSPIGLGPIHRIITELLRDNLPR